MFIRREHNFACLQGRQIPTQLKASDFRLLYQADSMLDEAREQAQTIIDQAQQTAQNIIQEAKEQAQQQAAEQVTAIEQDTWQQANSLLQALHDSDEQRWTMIEQSASQVLHSCLDQWFSSLDSSEKMRAVVERVMATQKPVSSGSIACHPQDEAAIQTLLDEYTQLPWTLETDTNIAPGAICLSVESGQFTCSWKAIETAILNTLTSDVESNSSESELISNEHLPLD